MSKEMTGKKGILDLDDDKGKKPRHSLHLGETGKKKMKDACLGRLEVTWGRMREARRGEGGVPGLW